MLPSGTGRRRGLAEARRGAAERERGKAARWWRETWPRRRGKPRPGRWHRWPRRVLRVLSRLDAAPRTVSAAPATLAGKGRVAQLRLAGPADRPCSLPGPVVSRVLCPGRTFLEGVCAPPKHSEYGVQQCLRPPGFRWRFCTSPPPPPHQG